MTFAIIHIVDRSATEYGAGALPGWVRKPGGRTARHDPSGDRARDQQNGIDLALRDDLVDLGIGLAEDPNRVPCRLEIAFRGLLIRGRLIDVFLRAAAGLQKLGGARQRPLLQFQHARGSRAASIQPAAGPDYRS